MPKPITVTLTWAEAEIAVTLGARRQLESLQKGLKDSYGFDGADGWTVHIEGAAGEIAFAKHYGIYPVYSVGTFKAPDFGKNIQIRTRSNRKYDLLVRPDANDDDIYVLVLGKMPEYMIWGWMQAKEAKKEGWLETYGGRPPAYFPQKEFLHDMSELFKPKEHHV
jgi:hypothetical protein